MTEETNQNETLVETWLSIPKLCETCGHVNIESEPLTAATGMKYVYGITINTAIAKAIQSVADTKYSGDILWAVRSPEVRTMLDVYAAATGQTLTEPQR